MRRIKLAMAMTATAVALSGCYTDKTWAPSPYPHNPKFDVYVNGTYVGSDPDPRIRASLRREAKESHNLR